MGCVFESGDVPLPRESLGKGGLFTGLSTSTLCPTLRCSCSKLEELHAVSCALTGLQGLRAAAGSLDVSAQGRRGWPSVG